MQCQFNKLGNTLKERILRRFFSDEIGLSKQFSPYSANGTEEINTLEQPQ